MSEVYRCVFCQAVLATAQGLRSHLTQSKLCRKRMDASYQSSDVASSTLTFQPVDQYRSLDAAINDMEPDWAGTLPTPHLDHPGTEGAIPLEGQPGRASQKRPAVTIEEVEDEDTPGSRTQRWIEDYPMPAGSVYGSCMSIFEKYRQKQREEGLPPWAPFQDMEEWETARWIMLSGISQERMKSLLNLEKVGDPTLRVPRIDTDPDQSCRAVVPEYENIAQRN